MTNRKLTRYTCNGIGIFKRLNDFRSIDIPEEEEDELRDAENEFDNYLNIPDICWSKEIKTVSYFTEAGLERFSEDIDTILYDLDIYIGPINKETTENTGNILYQDEYQVVLSA